VKFRDSLGSFLRQPAYADQVFALLGPAPCPVPKINYHYRYRLTLRCRPDKALRGLIAHLLREFARDKTTRGVTAFADVNPMD
jgi:primosomal protein N'